ncbi:hypothetical protein I4F81_009775 [Pyropia yezoensis]|uniref:Uncharacterized protein n=1 Tax=Pyropia yezoensis TaxID=2788 RepID=A0ACC3CBP8_PYRYE|nr:hypothetical protein I4F81_009775 [Neopyropia yezoensis]
MTPRFTTALVAAAVTLSLAATAAANSYTMVVKPTAKPTAKPTVKPAAPLAAVCHTTTTKCCWDPYVCDVVYKVKTVWVKAVCTRHVKVQVPCYSSRTADGHDQALGGPSERLFNNRRCYAWKAEKYGCGKKQTVKEAYPKLCYKKACTTRAVPAKFVAPTATVLTTKATAVPTAVPAKHNPATVKALFGQLAAALLAKHSS